MEKSSGDYIEQFVGAPGSGGPDGPARHVRGRRRRSGPARVSSSGPTPVGSLATPLTDVSAAPSPSPTLPVAIADAEADEEAQEDAEALMAGAL